MDAALLCGSFARKHSCQVEDYLVNPESEGQESNSTSRCPLILPCAYPGLMATAGKKDQRGQNYKKKKDRCQVAAIMSLLGDDSCVRRPDLVYRKKTTY